MLISGARSPAKEFKMTKQETINGIKARLGAMGIECKGDDFFDIRIKKGEVEYFFTFYDHAFSVSCWTGDTYISSVHLFYKDVNSVHGDEDTLIISLGTTFASFTLKERG